MNSINLNTLMMCKYLMESEKGKKPTKRTTLTINPDVKLVYDYSQKISPSKSTSQHLQSILMKKFETTDWDSLYKKAAEFFRRCRVHDKPHILICKTCELAFCEDCDITEHKDHDIQYYCTKHQMPYKRQCYLCEKESWDKKITIQGISGEELVSEIQDTNELIIIDVRGPDQSNHIKNAIHIPFHHFRDRTEKNVELRKMIENHPNAKWVTYSEGRIGHEDSMRGWLAVLDLRIMYSVQNAVFLRGGFVNFSEVFPEFCIHSIGESKFEKSNN